MICAYCGDETKGTKEHIISSGILDLFPECPLTIDSIRSKVHMGDPMVKDVCAKCNNNRIAYIDSYGKQMVMDNFMNKFEKDDNLLFSYDYTLLQKLLLKYSFNDMRSHKDDTSFFNNKILEFLKNEDNNEPLKNVTILAGLAVNTSPVPDYMFGNNKIRWGKNPTFLSQSIIENLNYETGEIFRRDNNPPQEFNNIVFSYLFRFNSGQFIVICWDENISDDDLLKNNIILKHQYPYVILDSSGKHTLTRCTSETTYYIDMLIDVSWGQSLFDDISRMRGTFSTERKKWREEVDQRWKEEENEIAKRYPR